MQPKTLFKINSKTHTDAVQKKAVIDKILSTCKIDYLTWSNILFETGCSFVEDKIESSALRQSLLKNPGLRYWDWWFMQFVKDDEWIVETGMTITEMQYRREKTRLTLLMVTNDNFEFFLNATLKDDE